MNYYELKKNKNTSDTFHEDNLPPGDPQEAINRSTKTNSLGVDSPFVRK